MPQPNVVAEPLVVRRVFDAPVRTVWRAWSDPAVAGRWSWGREFDTIAIDLRCETGGTWTQHIRSRDTGVSWFFEGVFHDVVPHERIVHTFHFRSERGDDEPESLVTVEFHDRGRQTEVVLTHERLLPEKVGETTSGWNDCFTRIGQVLEAERGER